MSKKFKFWSIVLLGINSIVGSGIFLLPHDAYVSFGPRSLYVILFTTILVVCFVLCFAEMSGKYKKAGGAYTYAMESFGQGVGFQVGFFNFFSATLTWSISAVALSDVLGVYYPFLTTPLMVAAISIIFIFFSAIINIIGIKESEFVNNIFTLAKLLPLLFFCITGLFFIKKANFVAPHLVAGTPLSYNFSGTVLLLFYAFAGFEMVPIASKDMHNPTRNIPIAVIATVLLVCLFYFIILLNCIGILGPHLANSTNPLAQAMSTYLGGIGFKFIWWGTLISIIGLLIATGFEGPRTIVALAEDGFIPRTLGRHNKKQIPTNATIFMAVVAAIIAASGTFTFLVKAESIVLLLLYLPTCLAVLKSRKNKVPGSFIIPFGKLVVFIALIMSLYLFVSTSLVEIAYGMGGLIFSIILYFGYSKRKKRSLHS